MKQRTIQVCLSPALLANHTLTNKIVVVIDILRATTSLCVAFDRGVSAVIPVETIDECRYYQQNGFLAAAERNGQTVEGFDFGNSPFSFMDDVLIGKKLAVTTTNGTRAIHASKTAKMIVLGAFANFSVLCQWLKTRPESVILLCSGWKNNVNLEDSAFAGAVVHELQNDFELGDDASVMALALYESANNSKTWYLRHSSHYQRLIELDLLKDVKYCLKKDTHPVIPFLEGNELKVLNLTQTPSSQNGEFVFVTNRNGKKSK